MTALAVIAVCVVAGIALVGLLVRLAQRQGAMQERTTALSQAEAQTIKNLNDREAIDHEINVDPDLVARARRSGVVRADPGK